MTEIKDSLVQELGDTITQIIGRAPLGWVLILVPAVAAPDDDTVVNAGVTSNMDPQGIKDTLSDCLKATEMVEYGHG